MGVDDEVPLVVSGSSRDGWEEGLHGRDSTAALHSTHSTCQQAAFLRVLSGRSSVRKATIT